MKNKNVNRREFIRLCAASGVALALGGITGCDINGDSVSSSEDSSDNTHIPGVDSFDFDVIIAGAGPGGCLAALRLAEQGFSTGLFDSNDEDNVGNPVVLAVESDIFDTVGIPHPRGDMLAYNNERERIFSPSGNECFAINCMEHPWPVAIHLNKLTRSIFSDALENGVRFYGGYRAVGPLCRGNRVYGVRFDSPQGTVDIKARLVIDATGYSAALARNLPLSFNMRFPEIPGDIVSAANRYCRIDPDAAITAVNDGLHGAEEGWNRMGKLGVYSTFFSCLSLADETAYILTGCKRNFETPDTTAGMTADGYMDEAGYFAERISAAESFIRISNSLDAPVADGFMALGEAACQTVTIHASGVASSLYAGHLASRTAAKALSAGDTSMRALWPYAAEYQRTRGAIIAGLDVTRRTVDRLTVENVQIMLESGIMHREDYVGGVLVSEPAITPASMPERMGGFLRHPAFVPVLLRMGLGATGMVKHYRNYPEKFDRLSFAKWRMAKELLFNKTAMSIPGQH